MATGELAVRSAARAPASPVAAGSNPVVASIAERRRPRSHTSNCVPAATARHGQRPVASGAPQPSNHRRKRLRYSISNGQHPCGRSEGPSPPLRSARCVIRIGIGERAPMLIVTAYLPPDVGYILTTIVMETVRTLGREYSMAILGATETPASVASLSESLGIPIATCYRRVSELTTVGLLDECRSDEESTSKATRYQRTTSAVAIRFGPAPSLWARAFVLVADDADASPLATSPNKERRSRVRSARVSVPVRDAEAANEQPETVKND